LRLNRCAAQAQPEKHQNAPFHFCSARNSLFAGYLLTEQLLAVKRKPRGPVTGGRNAEIVIPEGWRRIARRFNAGITSQRALSPEGTVEPDCLSRPSGTPRTSPALKSWWHWSSSSARFTSLSPPARSPIVWVIPLERF
jgi:hypothetical protein